MASVSAPRVQAAQVDLITQPRGGELYVVGQMQQVRIQKGSLTGNILVELTRNGTDFETLGTIDAPSVTNKKEFVLSFAVTGPATSVAQIRASGTTRKGPVSILSSNFSIVTTITPTLPLPYLATVNLPTLAFKITNTGAGGVNESQINNPSNNQDAVAGITNGSGNGGTFINQASSGATTGVLGHVSSPTGSAVEAKYFGTGLGVALELNNGAIKISGTNRCAFVHTATASNKISANGTDVDNPMCNGDPNCILIITQKLNPSGIVYNNSPMGVFYNTVRSKWEIFNENNVAIPNNAQFNVLVIKQ
jgi:hypothetical protein